MELQVTFQMRQALYQLFQQDIADYICTLIAKDQAHQRLEDIENGKTEIGEPDRAATGSHEQGERQDCEEAGAPAESPGEA